jgi:hypothetical protein
VSRVRHAPSVDDRAGYEEQDQPDRKIKLLLEFGYGLRSLPLAYLLRNRFYIGEVVFKGEVCPAEHPPILDTDLFEAVQQSLLNSAIALSCRPASSDALLMGRIFDDRGNRMSPSHSCKDAARHRYYVS